MTAELAVLIPFVLLLVIMYYKNKSDVRKRLKKMKKATNVSMRKKATLGVNRSKKKSFYDRSL